MPETLYEKFSWMRDDLKFVGVRGNKAQFKGIALYPTVSGNGKKYVKEELIRAARTLVGKPLTLNHNMEKMKGTVTWAEEEDDRIEYVAESNDNEYVQKLKDRQTITKEAYVKKWGRDPIYGVSVEANYRYHEPACKDGRCVQPHGIIFNALSLVEDPERPGVQGTTIELLETQSHNERGLMETLVKDVVPKEFQSDTKLSQTIIKEKKMEECNCPPGEHMVNGECVPDMAESLDVKQELETIALNHRHAEERQIKENKRLTESITTARKELSDKIGEVDKERQTCCTRLGEAQKQLVEVEALSKGALEQIISVKKWQSDSEVILQANTQAIGKLPNLEETLKPMREKLEQTPWKTELAELTKSVQTLTETLATANKTITEMQGKYVTLNNVYEALEKKHGDFVKETNALKAKETESKDAKINELTDEIKKLKETQEKAGEDIDTLRTHVKPNFKAKDQPPTKKDVPVVAAPYGY